MQQIILILMIVVFIKFGMDFKSREGVSRFVPHSLLTLMKLNAMWILAVYSWAVVHLQSLSPLVVLGLVFQLFGLLFVVWAKLELKQSFTWTGMYKKDGDLITTGPYRWVRHPLYLGVFGFELGGLMVFYDQGILSLPFETWVNWCLVLPSLLYVMMFNLLMSKRESKRLEEVFGEDYRRYQANTPAYFPRLLSRKGSYVGVEQC